MKKILIADDNKQITTILSGYAKKEGFEPVIALDGAEALDKYLQYEHEIAVVLLDVMMPEIDGFEVCRRLRKESMVPIIMITARGEDYDKIMGLDIGADDYVLKPFSALEVMARVRAVLRRLGAQEPANAQTLSYANLYINLEKYAVQINGRKYRGGSTYCPLTEWKTTNGTIIDVPQTFLIGAAQSADGSKKQQFWSGTLYQCKVYKGLLSDDKVNDYIEKGW